MDDVDINLQTSEQTLWKILDGVDNTNVSVFYNYLYK